MTIGQKIAQYRNAAYLSQRELGRRIHKTGQYISYLENADKSNPSLEVLNKIADALGISTTDLISESKLSFSETMPVARMEKNCERSNNHMKLYCFKNNKICPVQEILIFAEDENEAWKILKQKSLEEIKKGEEINLYDGAELDKDNIYEIKKGLPYYRDI